MKVLALNSSPRGGGQSKTELMMNHLVGGMREAGAEVEVVTLREKTIRNCIGCFTCWTKTPGTCIHKDDMTKDLLPKWLESDLVVYATPLYNYTINATLKAFIERILPAIKPFFEIHEGRMFHPVRGKYPPVVVLSVSGMPDEGHFNALSAHMRYVFDSPGRKLVGEIYRPGAEIMMSPFLKEKVDDVLDATAQAGRELVRSMQISTGTMARITQPLMEPQFFAGMANVMWKTCIAEGVTVKEFAEKKMVPRPDSIESFLLLFPLGLNAKAFGEKKVVLQFRFLGEVEDACYFTIETGKVGAQSGTSASPDLTVETPFEVWMDILTGKADGRQMLKEQRYKVSGDLSLMMHLFQKA
ncbi:MAG TPA: NAD(P)H-dependent oxidoreductase [Thermodesulfovibrionales bacterium]|nr:NAD(P)H-dependent oxidoreductase [Thermodesulfovibrionales bacterium]